MQDVEFTQYILERGRSLYRDMPWRQDIRPYYILVSEIMLQQTQVTRVTPKFEAFVAHFSTVHELSEASLASVLELWSGLGYNRRAKFLWHSAQMIDREYGGVLPSTAEEIQKLPGVGKNTAGAIVAYAYNLPSYFIETNVRTVYIHHFFASEEVVDDAAIYERLKATLPVEDVRTFYWALMDYGAWLKARGIKYNPRSKHYRKQTPLSGSVRQLRGELLRSLLDRPVNFSQLKNRYANDPRFTSAVEGLQRDGLIERKQGFVSLTGL